MSFVDTSAKVISIEASPERCPEPQPEESQPSLAVACERRMMAREAYDEIILGMLIVKKNPFGQELACEQDTERLSVARAELDVAEQDYKLAVEESVLY